MATTLTPVAARIVEARKAKKLSRQQLADKLKTTYLQVYRIETGVTEVSLDTAARYAKALRVPVEFLLLGESKAAS